MDKPCGLNIRFTVIPRRGSLGMKLHHRIGLVYLPGALPCFEDFGNLPTDLVCSDALVDGKPASEVLDMLIIPGGSLVESQSVNDKVTREIIKMAESGKFVLGVCSGFQVLAKETDVGRLSTIPITREGLGLLDAEFKPLVCTDRVKATVVDKSFITQEVGKEVSGFHCHTYGKIVLHQDAKPIIITHANRVNYKKDPQDLISGVANKEGNVVGVFIHSLLDHNPTILESITKSLDINAVELDLIRQANGKLLEQIKGEIGISTNVRQGVINQSTTRLLMVTATGSGSGKTFIVTGIAGALKKKGYQVGVIKVGGDIRDAVPTLYLIKEPIKDYSSIKIGESGWTPLQQAVEEASKKYNFLLVEGAMSAFTGLLNENYKRPMSTAEVAAALGASTIVVVGCDKEGIEGALINTLNYVNILKSLGVNTTGVILNKLRVSYITDEIRQTMKGAFQNAGIELLGMVPRLDLEGRGMIPEIEIRYEDFGAQAIDAAEKYIDLDLLAKVASAPKQVNVDYAAFMEKFKKLLTNYSLNTFEGGKPKSCS
ncbi:MAG: AAA family ATPase [Candidatus Bathyarchaeota archaeon]|nr:AAA family ATPase [Candidatus Bathyarchaeota archaeon]